MSIFEYKFFESNVPIDSSEFESTEQEGNEFKCYHELFYQLAKARQFEQIDEFIKLLEKLISMILQSPDQFNIFASRSENLMHSFFQQFSDVLNFSGNGDKESLIIHLEHLIQNELFSSLFSRFKGDLLLINFYKTVSDNFDDHILNIFVQMKRLSLEFPILILRDHFQSNEEDFRFTQIFVNMMDECKDINSLFEKYLLFPSAQRKNFSLFCLVIISFFRHSLDEQLFVQSNYYDRLNSCFRSDFSKFEILYFLRITATLRYHNEVITKVSPDFVFSVLKSTKNKDKYYFRIIDACLAIINELIKLNSSIEFIQKYVDLSVISVLFNNLVNESYNLRVRSLFLLISLIEYSDFHIFGILLQFTGNFNDEVKTTDFCDFISKTIFDLILTGDEVTVLTLKLANLIFNFVQLPDNYQLLLRVLDIWQKCGLVEIIKDLTENNDKVSEDARILYQKIINKLEINMIVLDDAA